MIEAVQAVDAMDVTDVIDAVDATDAADSFDAFDAYDGFVALDRQASPQPPAPWAKSDPADSLYRLAREALSRGDYKRAA
ncbi:MAG TPA: hypothetical protein VGO75_02525, partial [Gemmatimonadaceae bacterium]|nr:hypothetical protein [Gemmatimonadaceae bacterium]